MKLKNLLVVVAALGLSLAAKSEEKAEKALDVKTPIIGVEGAKARYTLINFWSREDVASIKKVAEFEKELKSAKSDKIEIVAVAFDLLKMAYEANGVGKDGVYSDAYKTYKVRKSLSNYLVDANGKVVARDLTAEKLAYYMNANN